MIVDDDQFFVHTISSVLSQQNVKVISESRTENAIRRLEEGERPDLLMMNIEMPEIGGDQACQVLKDTPEFQELPILLYSVTEEGELARLARVSNADGYLRKPFSPYRVTEWIHANKDLFEGSLPSAPPVLPPRVSIAPVRPMGAPPPPPPIPTAMKEAIENPAPPPPPDSLPPAAPSSSLDDQVPMQPTESLRVLMVDDDALALMILSDALEDEGYELHRAKNWSSFRNKIVSERFAVLVLDINLPEIKGDKLALFVEDFVEPPKPKILLHSGVEVAELQKLADQLGAFGILPKGCDDQEIQEKVLQAAHEFTVEWRKIDPGAFS